jgi:hypothetical protein
MSTTDRGPDFTPENEAADERRMFYGAFEPMRALRDLISLCEQTFGGREEQEIIAQAQNGFTALRKLFGDTRPAEDIAGAGMLEPVCTPNHIEVLQLTAGALQCVATLLPFGEAHVVRFTGKWAGFAPQTVSQILYRADAAIKPKAGG